MNVIGLAGLLGPVRKRARLTYGAVCPSCRGVNSLSIQVTPHGEISRCAGPCNVVEVREAFARLNSAEHSVSTETECSVRRAGVARPEGAALTRAALPAFLQALTLLLRLQRPGGGTLTGVLGRRREHLRWRGTPPLFAPFLLARPGGAVSPWLDIDEAADYLRCSGGTQRIYDLVSQGRLTPGGTEGACPTSARSSTTYLGEGQAAA